MFRLQLTGSDLFGPREGDEVHSYPEGRGPADAHDDEDHGRNTAQALLEHPADSVTLTQAAGCAVEAAIMTDTRISP